ncbi:MAG: TetR/AcrR family transcriptional regulator [Actinomycetota bacterium]|nr:TetR/AcrR family transcriptional regulator [Actinomycetota bacterium]
MATGRDVDGREGAEGGGSPDRAEVRERIVGAASALLAAEGSSALTTRAVASAAGVQPPTIYRLFGDKDGLLEALAHHALTTYVDRKRVRPVGVDPVEDLRRGWDLHVGFGLANPELYPLIHGAPRSGASPSAAAVEGRHMLEELVGRIAAAGRLRVDETLAADLLQAAGSGTIMTLLAAPGADRDDGLSVAAREAVIAAIVTDAPVADEPGPVAVAVAMRAVLGGIDALSDAERRLMAEWLDRIVAGARDDRRD